MPQNTPPPPRLRSRVAAILAACLLATAWAIPAAASDLEDQAHETLVRLALEGPEAAVPALEGVLDEARAAENRRAEGMVLWGLAAARSWEGDFARARELATASEGIWKALDEPDWVQRVGFQAGIAGALAHEPPTRLAAARAAFAADVSLLEVGRGHLGNALRVIERAILALEDVEDPVARQLQGPLFLARETIHRSLNLPVDSSGTLTRLRGMLLGSEEEVDLLLGVFELMELGERDAPGDQLMRHLAELVGDDPELDDHQVTEILRLHEASQRDGFPAWLAYCGYIPDESTADEPSLGDTNELREFICSYMELLEPTIASRRIELQTVRNVLGRMMETFTTGESGSQMVAGRTVLSLESALGEPTAPENWPSTEELTTLLEAGERRYADVPLELRAGLDSVLSLFTQVAVRLRIRAGDPAGAFDLAERARARAFFDRLTASRMARIEPGALDEIASLRRQRDDLGRRLVEVSSIEPAGPEAVRLAEERSNVQAEIDTTFRRLALSAPPAERAPLASLEDVRHTLDEDTTLVAFMDFPEQPERPLAWVIDRRSGGGLRTYVFPSAYLESRVALWGQQIRNGHDESLAADLYRALWAPLAEHIDTRNVVLVPHGVFQDVPFAALRDPDTGRRLIEDHALLYAPSASAWVHLESRPAQQGKDTLILGDPGGDLPGAAEAARTLGAIWGVPPLLAEAATEWALRERAPDAGLIHVASHGRQAAEPAFTHLRLAPGADGPVDPRADGRLELYEISEQLDLGRTALAVLPSCHTGTGPRTRGDEVASLARAFLLAGARSVVTTGSAVDDGAAAALMVDFHRHLSSGVEAAEALRRAQVAALGSAGRSEPRHWAAFALHGTDGRVAPASSRDPVPAGEIVLSDRTLEALEVFGREGWADSSVLEEALRAAWEAGHPEDEAALLWALSQAAIEEGRFADALDLARRGRAAWESLGDDEWARRLAGWETLAADLVAGEPAAPPLLRAYFLAELIEIEMDRLRLAETLRQAELALSLIDGLGQDGLALRLRLARAAASGMSEASEATLAELSAVMDEGAQVIAAERSDGSPDVTPLVEALPELMLSMSSGNFEAGLKVLEELAEEHGELLPPETMELLEMVGHLEDQNTDAAADWCRRSEGAAAPIPGSAQARQASLRGLLCSLTDFLATTETVDDGAVDLAALGDLFRATGEHMEGQEGPLRAPLEVLNQYMTELVRATERGGEMPSTDGLLAVVEELDALPGALPLTRRSGIDQALVAPFGQVATLMSAHAGNAAESFELAERVRAREFLDLLVDVRAQSVEDEETAGAIATLRRRADSLEARLGELTVSDPSAPEITTLREELKTTRVEIDDRFEQLALRRGETARTAPVPLAEIQTALGDDTTLVAYMILNPTQDDSFAEEPLAWVVDRDGVELVRLDADPEALIQDVRLFVRRLRDRQEVGELAETLYAALWQPLREHIGTRRVLVVPHGVLLELPFAALRDPDGGAELVRQATLLYAPSASAWVRLRERSPGNGARLVMGNPARDLDAAEAEARALATLWNTPALNGAAATERRFRELAPGASLVHVASHGVLAPIDPAFSYLKLAPSADAESDPRADGRLELHEMIGGLDLSGTGLVVLSACRAGAGPTTRGGEMANLARGLLLAGARSAVAAAWEVDDRAAESLMIDFHRRLSAGVEAAEALRGAQEAALAGTEHRHPGFWAGFALHGAGGTITPPKGR